MESIWRQKLYAWEVRSQRSTPVAAASYSAADAQRLSAAPWSAPHADGPPVAATTGFHGEFQPSRSA